MQVMEQTGTKKRFGRFFYDLSKYSLKELICNYFVFFGWILALIIEIINCSVHASYIKALSEGQIVAQPWLFERLTRFAFVFLAMTIFGGIIKIWWSHKRKKGTLLSYYETLETKQSFEIEQKNPTTWVIKGLYIFLAVAGIAIVMLAVWYF